MGIYIAIGRGPATATVSFMAALATILHVYDHDMKYFDEDRVISLVILCSMFCVIAVPVCFVPSDTIASAQTTNPEPQLDRADSAAAVVGGVLSGIILAILVVLFMLVVTLVVQRRTKGSAPVAGVEVESGDPVDNGVNLMSVQQLKPEENNIQASDSIEKLNDNNSLETAAPTTDKMDEIL